MGVISTRAQARGGGTGSGRKGFLAMFRKDPVLVPVPFLEPGQCPHPVSLFHKRQNQLAQGAKQAEKEWEKVSNWVRDLLNQGVDLSVEVGRMELGLEELKEERERLEWEASGLGVAGQVAASSVSGKYQDASVGTRSPKKKKAKQKSYPGVPLQERQEYISPI